MAFGQSRIKQRNRDGRVFDRSQHLDTQPPISLTSFLFNMAAVVSNAGINLSKIKKDETYIFHFFVLTASRRPISIYSFFLFLGVGRLMLWNKKGRDVSYDAILCWAHLLLFFIIFSLVWAQH
jgi:hypothetical protein